MWKINNEENKKYLDDFDNKLIRPLFKEIINYKKLKLSCGYLKYLENNNDTIYKNSNKLLVYISKRSIKKVRFSDLINSFISTNTLKDIEDYYSLYLEQNRKINKKNYNVKEEKIDDDLKKIFIEFFYESFFNKDKIWSLIDSSKYKEGYSRSRFHENFKRENNIYICPYCDMDTIINTSNKEVEHFLPKSKYPFLAMNAYNLISSCIACNKSIEGKGTTIYIPINSPYNKQIGEEVIYTNDIINKQITLQGNDKKTINYLKTLNLIERYKSNTIFEIVQEKAESLYDLIIEAGLNNDEIDEKILRDYMIAKLRRTKTEVLSFAIIGTFSGLDLYREYIKNRKSKTEFL